MADKTFVVTHPKARKPITIKGKTLEEALQKEGLSPLLWKQVEDTESSPNTNNG